MKRLMLTGVLLVLAAVGCGRDNETPIDGRAGQPAPSAPQGLGEGCNNLPVADEFERVDRYTPTFATAARIDNPFFPMATLTRVVSIGTEDGEEVRIESTRLKDSRVITLEDGTRVRAVQVRSVEWRDGALAEVTTDFYAQDDIGAVWYLGEDVSHYEDGRIVGTEGSWLAGRDGAPPGMIMPANPALGDAWRPENNCGVIFEEMTVIEEDVDVDGPSGPISGVMRVRVLEMNGTIEEKLFARGYGELVDGTDPDAIKVALANPIDEKPGSTPEEFGTLFQYAEFVANFAPFQRWAGLAGMASKMRTLSESVQAEGIPPLFEEPLFDALEALDTAIGGQDANGAIQAAIDFEMALIDLRLSYENSWLIDSARLKVWGRQLSLDRRLGDAEAIRNDLAIIAAIKQLLV